MNTARKALVLLVQVLVLQPDCRTPTSLVGMEHSRLFSTISASNNWCLALSDYVPLYVHTKAWESKVQSVLQ
jgi:hypothetical protein